MLSRRRRYKLQSEPKERDTQCVTNLKVPKKKKTQSGTNSRKVEGFNSRELRAVSDICEYKGTVLYLSEREKLKNEKRSDTKRRNGSTVCGTNVLSGSTS